VVDLGLGTASDIQIVERAEADGYVIVTADTDFPMLVACDESVDRIAARGH